MLGNSRQIGAGRLSLILCALLAVGADAWPTWAAAGGPVPALKGDGAYRLLRRHGLDPQTSLAEFQRLNAGQLGPDNLLIEGRLYRLPGKAADVEVVREPLFGKALERVEVQDHRLRGASFYLVSGHGGPDPGGMAVLRGHTLCEDEYAYDVTLRLGRLLLEHGAKVTFVIQDKNDGIRDDKYLKPDSDEVCYPGRRIPLSQVERLEQRTAAVNGLYRQDSKVPYRRCLAFHVDSRRKGEDIDIFFYHQAGNRLGQRLAETLRRVIRANYQKHQPGRGYEGSVTTRGLYVLNNVAAPLVFLELGNIHHPRDQERLLEANNRQAVANWLREGILADYESQ